MLIRCYLDLDLDLDLPIYTSSVDNLAIEGTGGNNLRDSFMTILKYFMSCKSL